MDSNWVVELRLAIATRSTLSFRHRRRQGRCHHRLLSVVHVAPGPAVVLTVMAVCTESTTGRSTNTYRTSSDAYGRRSIARSIHFTGSRSFRTAVSCSFSKSPRKIQSVESILTWPMCWCRQYIPLRLCKDSKRQRPKCGARSNRGTWSGSGTSLT